LLLEDQSIIPNISKRRATTTTSNAHVCKRYPLERSGRNVHSLVVLSKAGQRDSDRYEVRLWPDKEPKQTEYDIGLERNKSKPNTQTVSATNV
jgi:hypothetical protein